MERTRCLGWAPLSHRGGAPTAKPGFSPNRRSTRPGCEWGGLGVLAGLRFRTVAVLLQQNRDSPRTVGAPAPGANGADSVSWLGSAFAPGRTRCSGRTSLSHRGGAPTAKPGFSPNRGSTRPGSAAVGYVGGAAAVDVGEDQVQGFAAAAGGGVVYDGGDGPALAVVVAGDAGDGADVAQGAGLDVGLAGHRGIAQASAHGAVHGRQGQGGDELGGIGAAPGVAQQLTHVPGRHALHARQPGTVFQYQPIGLNALVGQPLVDDAGGGLVVVGVRRTALFAAYGQEQLARHGVVAELVDIPGNVHQVR